MKHPTPVAIAELCGPDVEDAVTPSEGPVLQLQPQEEFPIYAPVTRSVTGLYVDWLMEPEPKNGYTVALCFECSESLDTTCLQGAVESLLSWHEVFRTRFGQYDRDALQMVEKTCA